MWQIQACAGVYMSREIRAGACNRDGSTNKLKLAGRTSPCHAHGVPCNVQSNAIARMQTDSLDPGFQGTLFLHAYVTHEISLTSLARLTTNHGLI
jgi:hypothetical protein